MTSPAHRARNRLCAGGKGHASPMANVYLVRDLLTGTEVGLVGDHRFDLFYYLEGDPLVGTAKHGRIAREFWGQAHSEPDALVAECSGRTRLVWLHASEDSLREEVPHIALQCISFEQLARNQMRIANWVRLAGCIHRARGYAVTPLRREVRRRVGEQGATVEQVRDHLAACHPCLVYGAIAMELRARTLAAELDRLPLSGALRLTRHA